METPPLLKICARLTSLVDQVLDYPKLEFQIFSYQISLLVIALQREKECLGLQARFMPMSNTVTTY